MRGTGLDYNWRPAIPTTNDDEGKALDHLLLVELFIIRLKSETQQAQQVVNEFRAAIGDGGSAEDLELISRLEGRLAEMRLALVEMAQVRDMLISED